MSDRVYDYHKIKTYTGDFRFKSCWSDLSCEFTVLHRDTAWKAEVSEDYLKNHSKTISIPAPDFFEKLKSYIFAPTENIEITIADNKFTMHLKGMKVRVKFFTVDLEPLDYKQTLKEWFDELLLKNKEIGSTVKAREDKIANLREDMQKCRKIFHKYISDKQSHEKKLMSGFVQVLNAKKRRIQFLTEVIEANRYKMDIEVEPSQSKTESQKEITIETVSDSESEYNTDKEDKNYEIEDCSDPEDKQYENLLADSPPPVTLAPRVSRVVNYDDVSPSKRKRTEEESDGNDINGQPSTSNADTLPPTITVENDVEKEKSPEHFSTQDIMDRLF